jgi:hypothetical protein
MEEVGKIFLKKMSETYHMSLRCNIYYVLPSAKRETTLPWVFNMFEGSILMSSATNY